MVIRILPLHRVTEAMRRHEGARPPSGSVRLARPARLQSSTLSASQAPAKSASPFMTETLLMSRGLARSSCHN